MATNNDNKTFKIPGRLPFTFRADYYFDGSTDGKSEIFDYDNLRNDRIQEISGWAIVNAGLGGEDEDEIFNPGVYLSVQIGERHGVTMVVPEPELLKILADIQRLKSDFDISVAYNKDAAKANHYEDEWE